MAAGTPALITPGCNFPEAGDAGAAIIVDPRRAEIAGGLATLINMSNSDLLEMGSKGRELVLKSFTWDLAARRLATVYRTISNNETIPFLPEPSEYVR